MTTKRKCAVRIDRSVTVLASALALILFVFSVTLEKLESQTTQQQSPQPAIDWKKGPTTGNLNGIAEIKVPDGFMFTDRAGAQKLLELTQNPISGDEVGAVVPSSGDQNWFVIFEFHELGYIKDEDRNHLDANALLKSIQDGTEEQNEIRKKRGWPVLHVTGWQHSPFYDVQTNNLTWATQSEDEKGEHGVNHSVRILGRRGVMSVDLVTSPAEYTATVSSFNSLLSNLAFRPGSRYADFVKGDKVAEYGLAALIVGGAGTVAVKTGLFAKAWKLILAVLLALKKLIIVVFAAMAAAIKKAWNWITGRRASQDEFSGQSTNYSNAPLDSGRDEQTAVSVKDE